MKTRKSGEFFDLVWGAISIYTEVGPLVNRAFDMIG